MLSSMMQSSLLNGKKAGKRSNEKKNVEKKNTAGFPQGAEDEQSQGMLPYKVPTLEDKYNEALSKRPGQEGSPAGEDAQFEDRLAALKATSTLLAKEKAIESNKGVLATSDDAYANPPSILSTMSTTTEDPDRVNPLGNNQLVIVAGTVILGAILIFSSVGSGGDFVSQSGISPEEKTRLEAQLAGFEATLKDDADDTSALEGAAVTYANLQDYKKAEELLTQLTALKADDPDVWRLLAETRSATKDSGKAVAAYAQALKLAGEDLEILKGYAGALVADGKPAEAIKEITLLSERLKSSEAAESSQTSSTRPTPIELDLLLAKVYSQWRGHTTDALAKYDAIISAHPTDFRGYLAKGVLLRQEGRKGDADRAFLSARFMAPKELRAIVDRVAAPEDAGNF